MYEDTPFATAAHKSRGKNEIQRQNPFNSSFFGLFMTLPEASDRRTLANGGTSVTNTNQLSSHMHQRRNGRRPDNNKNHYNPSNLENGDSMRGNDMNSNILEQQNNERISELSSQVAHLKRLTIDIGNEVNEQNRFLDGMGDGFSNTRDLLAGSLRQIGTMLESGGAKHMCYMVGFVVFVMVFLYWVMTFKGTSGA